MAASVRLARRVLRSDGSAGVLAFQLVRQLVLALLLIFCAQVARAAQCPINPATNEMWPSWDTSKQITATSASWSVALCGGAGASASSISGGTTATIGEAVAAAETALQNRYSGTGTITKTYYYSSSPDYYNVCLVDTSVSRSVRARVLVVNETCTPPPPPSMDCAANKGKFHTYEQDTAAALGGKACTSGCEVFVNFGGVQRPNGKYGMVGQVTGATCSGANTAPVESAPKPDNEVCATTESGATFCVPYGKKNCGYYNSEYVCAPSKDKCLDLPSGKRVCAEGTGTPPAPDTGTRGVPAPPDDKIKTVKSDADAPGEATPANGTTGNTTNVYNSNTVAGSSGAGTGGTGAEGTGTGGTGGTGGSVGGTGTPATDGEEEEGDGTAGTCTGANCEFAIPEMADVPSLEEAAQSSFAALQAAPIVAAFASIGTTWPTGSCPMGAINLGEYGGTQDLGSWACDLWADAIAPVLSVIMLAFWSFLGLRIIMEA